MFNIDIEKLSRQTIADLHRIINDATQIGESKSNISDTVTEEEKVSFKSTIDDLAQMNRKQLILNFMLLIFYYLMN